MQIVALSETIDLVPSPVVATVAVKPPPTVWPAAGRLLIEGAEGVALIAVALIVALLTAFQLVSPA